MDDMAVGYCSNGKKDESIAITISDESMRRFQKKWETNVGKVFSEVVLETSGVAAKSDAHFVAGMHMGPKRCDRMNSNSIYVFYAASPEVLTRVGWFNSFVKKNVQLYAQNKAAVAPIEFAAVAQKWFIALHPFADGNGRTSRAVQDILLAHLGLPFAPSGDLQDDATAELESYVELTYQKTEAMLTVLETCAEGITAGHVSFACKNVENIISDASKSRSVFNLNN
ncbi:MAG: Fic family protein [Bdellovibrio sp.]|nr:Fic family protein [Bdellovibrio sp.]